MARRLKAVMLGAALMALASQTSLAGGALIGDFLSQPKMLFGGNSRSDMLIEVTVKWVCDPGYSKCTFSCQDQYRPGHCTDGPTDYHHPAGWCNQQLGICLNKCRVSHCYTQNEPKNPVMKAPDQCAKMPWLPKCRAWKNPSYNPRYRHK